MPKAKLTKTFVDKMPFAKKGQLIYCDTELRGFYLIIGAQSKTYVAQKDIRGKSIRCTIGRHGHFTPEEARRIAKDHLYHMAQGINPIELEKEEQSKSVTLSAALTSYLGTRKKLRERTVADYQYYVSKYLADWRDKPMVDISRDMVMERHVLIGEENGPRAANGTMQFLWALFNHTNATYDKPLKFRAGAPETEELTENIREKLVLYACNKGVAANRVDDVLDRLLSKVFERASESERSALRYSQFIELFDGVTNITVPLEHYMALQSGRMMGVEIQTGFGVAEDQQETEKELDAELREIKRLIKEHKIECAKKRIQDYRNSRYPYVNNLLKYHCHIIEGVCSFKADNVKDGAQKLLEALKFNSNNARALANAALGAYHLGDFPLAEKYINDAIAQDDAEPYIYCAKINMASEAEEFDDLRSIVPNRFSQHAKINFSLGIQALKRDMLKEARHYLELALVNMADDPDLLGALGGVILETLFETKDSLRTQQINKLTRNELLIAKEYIEKACEITRSADFLCKAK